MPALVVVLNGKPLVSVATEDFGIVDVSVSGDVIGPEQAILRISGGTYPEGKPSTYLIWEDERSLVPGDSVSVEFSAAGTTSRPGKTVEELYGDREPFSPEPHNTPEKVVEELKRRPKQFALLAFELVNAEGAHIKGETLPSEHGFGFTVLWNYFHPETARTSVRTYALDSLITKEKGRYHAESKLSFGQGVTFIVGEAR